MSTDAPPTVTAAAEHLPPVARPRPVGLVLAVTGAASLALMFVLTLETLAVLRDPGHIPNCVAGSVFACGRVIDSWQAALMGFPNSLAGLVIFSAVTVLGLVLAARAAMPTWPVTVVWVLLTVMLGMSSWMMLQQFFVIGGLCTYCTGAWILTGPAWWYLTLHLWNRVAAGPAEGSPAGSSAGSSAAVAAARWHLVPLTVWFVVWAALFVWAFLDVLA